MKNHSKKRLDKIQVACGRASGVGCLRAIYTFCDVPNLAEAVKRARAACASKVAFVPVTGAIRDVEVVRARKNEIPGAAIAYEGTRPTLSQLRRLAKWNDPDCGSITHDTNVFGYSFQAGLAGQQVASVIFTGDGPGADFHVLVDPSEMPQSRL